MTNRIARLLRQAFDLPRLPHTMAAPQRQLYRALKRRYVRSSPEQRATMLTNVAAMRDTLTT